MSLLVSFTERRIEKFLKKMINSISSEGIAYYPILFTAEDAPPYSLEIKRLTPEEAEEFNKKIDELEKEMRE